MIRVKNTFEPLKILVVIISFFLSCSNFNKQTYYVESENDTIAYLSERDDLSKVAKLVNWHFDDYNDSVYKKIYSYFGLYGYKTIVQSQKHYSEINMSALPEDECTRLVLDGNANTIACLIQRNNDEGAIYTPIKYTIVDSLFLRDLVSDFHLNYCKIYDVKVVENEQLDCYAVADSKKLIVYDKPYQQDTLRLLDYGLFYIKNIYDSAKELASSKTILDNAIAIRDLGTFSIECMKKPEYKEKAVKVMDSLKFYQPYIYRRLRLCYEKILKEELEKYNIDNFMLYDDSEIQSKYELYISSKYFISECVCHDIYKKRNNLLRLLGIEQVTFNWSIYANNNYVIRVKPKPLSDEYIGWNH